MSRKVFRTLSYNVMAALDKTGVSKQAFCRAHNLSETTLERIIAGQNISLKTLDDWANELGVAPWQLLKEGGVE